jgi:hypothetical protein
MDLTTASLRVPPHMPVQGPSLRVARAGSSVVRQCQRLRSLARRRGGFRPGARPRAAPSADPWAGTTMGKLAIFGLDLDSVTRSGEVRGDCLLSAQADPTCFWRKSGGPHLANPPSWSRVSGPPLESGPILAAMCGDHSTALCEAGRQASRSHQALRSPTRRSFPSKLPKAVARFHKDCPTAACP